jgi:creatinine amidohydrolase
MIRRYAELRPEELAAALAANPTFICPWGALEWHGAHLPLGLDGIVAEAFSERLATATGAILLPGTWLPMTAHPPPP